MKIRTLGAVVIGSLVVCLLLVGTPLQAQPVPAPPGAPPVQADQGQEIAAAVTDALRYDTYTFPYPIAVAATDGKVELRGKVDSQFAKDRAQRVASQVPGVTALDNRLTIDANLFAKGDQQIMDETREDMVHNPLVRADDVMIQVADGVVTLRGEVIDIRAVQSATASAVQGGAKRVINKLTIRPNPNIILPSPWDSLRAPRPEAGVSMAGE